MKQWKKELYMILCVSLFSGLSIHSAMPVNAKTEETVIQIDRKFDFKKADQADKDKEYKKFDGHIQATTMPEDLKAMEYVKEITSEKEYLSLIEETNKEAKIVYLGFNECPFCRAFLPKLHAIAEDYDVTIYYYNVRDRMDDPNFQTIVEDFYKVNEVPHAFIVKDNKVVGEPLNSESSMKEKEDFIKKSLKK